MNYRTLPRQSVGTIVAVGNQMNLQLNRSTVSLLTLTTALSLTGCMKMLGIREPVPYAEQVAGPEKCFRSYLFPANGAHPGAHPAVARWYASLTPAIVQGLAKDATSGEFSDRVMAHAQAAGVHEGNFLSGTHPDPVSACGVSWNSEDVGTYRFDNAASAARSVVRRDAFATCAKQFDTIAPKLFALSKATSGELAALPRDADPYQMWSAYHRAMAAQRAILPIVEGEHLPVFAYAGAPYVAFTDMITRFSNTPYAFLAYHWMGGVSPFPDDAQHHIQPLDSVTDETKLHYCALTMRAQGPLMSAFSSEDIDKIFPPFDGQAWLDSQPTQGESYLRGTVHLAADDLRAGKTMDHDMGGKTGGDKDKFRLFQRIITNTALKNGKGTVELTKVEKLQRSYDCKNIAKLTPGQDGSATIEHLQVCKFDDTLLTNKLTLAVDTLPAGFSLNTGDEIIFFAKRTASDENRGSKPSARGMTSFRTITQQADLLFVAQIRRGAKVVYPAAL